MSRSRNKFNRKIEAAQVLQALLALLQRRLRPVLALELHPAVRSDVDDNCVHWLDIQPHTRHRDIISGS